MFARGGIAASVKSLNGQEGREAGVHGIENISSIMIRKGSTSVGFSRQEYWSGEPLPSPGMPLDFTKCSLLGKIALG